ncbi:hypothetical protein, partial [Nesterenkonia flava]|uniref:hypothetical protein n=1 Tax=Nesterenkonia flava TaxID=469799 RepID=UPI0031DD436C
HVEVFRVEGVGTSIIGRPRLLSSHRHAAAPRPCLYTLKYEEPHNSIMIYRTHITEREIEDLIDAQLEKLEAGLD